MQSIVIARRDPVLSGRAGRHWWAFFVVLAVSALLAGCASAPRHAALVQAEQAGTLPPLLPVRRFVANVDQIGGFVLSPDGQRLLWTQAVGLNSGIAVRMVDLNDASGRPAHTYPVGDRGAGGGLTTWLQDSRHFVFSKDPAGDENTQLWVQDADLSAYAPWQVVPASGGRVIFGGRSASNATSFYFASNGRDRASFDWFEADASTRTIREIARNDGTVLRWITDVNHQLAGRLRQSTAGNGAQTLIEWRHPDGSWRLVKTVDGFDSYAVLRVDRAQGKAIVLSNIGRDKIELLLTDLATGAETSLASHGSVDIAYASFAADDLRPVGFGMTPDYPEFRYLDESLARDVASAVASARQSGMLTEAPVFTRPQLVSDDRQRIIVRTLSTFESAELLLDRPTGQVQRLNTMHDQSTNWLAEQQPIAFKASDGRLIHGYLIRPRGVSGPAPMIVNIHGGPWARDVWSAATYSGNQLLANRGYAVLQINYRGSAGYGQEHLWAGAGESFGRIQDDIADGVQWAIDQRIADPQRLAVLGASFGGFSVLAQLIRKPHDYRCGVNIVGVANWPRTIESWPPYWRNRHYADRFFGAVDDPAQRERLLAQSPITHIDRLHAPLLVIQGANDVRVQRQDSDDVVAALRERKRPVEYLLFRNEGHSITKWRNRLAMWRRMEDFFADCLGGRSNGVDFYQLMPRW